MRMRNKKHSLPPQHSLSEMTNLNQQLVSQKSHLEKDKGRRRVSSWQQMMALLNRDLIMWRRNYKISMLEVAFPCLVYIVLCFLHSNAQIIYQPNLDPGLNDHKSFIQPFPKIPISEREQSQKIVEALFEQRQNSKDFYDFHNTSIIDSLAHGIFVQWVGDNCDKTELNKERMRWGVIGNQQESKILREVRDDLESYLKVRVMADNFRTSLNQFYSQLDPSKDKISREKLTIALEYFLLPTPISFNTLSDFQDYISHPLYEITEERPGLCFAIEISDNIGDGSQIPLNPEISARIHTDATPGRSPQQGYMRGEVISTQQIVPPTALPPYYKYEVNPKLFSVQLFIRQGYSIIQNWIANAVLRTITQNDKASIEIALEAFRVESTVFNDFERIMATIYSYISIINYLMPMYLFILRFQTEKQQGLRTHLNILGLSLRAQTFAILVSYSLRIALISLALILTMKIGGLFQKSISNNFFLFFSFLLIQGVASFGFIYFLTAAFPLKMHPKIAGMWGLLIYFGSTFADFTVQKSGVSEIKKVVISLIFPNVAIARANRNLCQFEYKPGGIGLNWNETFFESLDNYRISTFYLIMIYALISQICLGMVIEGYKSHGVFNMNKIISRSKVISQRSLVDDVSTEDTVCLNSITKIYSPTLPHALNSLNITLFRGEVLVLLGHNGAGKSTTLSILTGMIDPSIGDVEVFGKKVISAQNRVNPIDLREYRRMLGKCPQHEILFEDLTVEENFKIHCRIKGVWGEESKVNRMINCLELSAHRLTIARNLSGGNRRKLSVGIALVADSEVVILDEPSTGMDAQSRVKLWEVIREEKRGRVIVLTTHNMEEAELLADRVAILKQGQLIACGSAQILKQQDSSHLSLNIQTQDGGEYFVNQLSQVGIKSVEIQQIDQLNLKVKFDRRKQREDINSLFELLEKDNSKITKIEALTSSLQDAFLNISGQSTQPNINIPVPTSSNHRCQLQVQLRKSLRVISRRKGDQLLEILVPVIIVCLGLFFTKFQLTQFNPIRDISPLVFPPHQRIMINSDLPSFSPHSITPHQLSQYFPYFQKNAYDFEFKNISEIDKKSLKQSFEETLYKTKDSESNQSYPYRYGAYYMVKSDNQSKQFQSITYLNLTSQEGIIFYPQYLYSAIINAASGLDVKFNLQTVPYPPGRSKEQDMTTNGVFIQLVVGIGMALIPTGIASRVVSEREQGLKHMQVIGGVTVVTYWVSFFLLDLLISSIPSILISCILFYTEILPSFSTPLIPKMFIVYPFVIIPQTYLLQLIFEKEITAQTVTLQLHLLMSSISCMIVYGFRMLKYTARFGDRLVWFFRLISPSFSICNAIVFAINRDELVDRRELIISETYRDNWDDSQRPNSINNDPNDLTNLRGDLVGLYIIAFIYTFIFLIVISLRFVKKIWQKPYNQEQDQEGFGVRTGIQIQNLRKEYKVSCSHPIVAIQDLSFSVNRGQRFALLGENGAGKSTTFKIITNEISPSQGQVLIDGLQIARDFDALRPKIGYCPQKNALFQKMSVWEHLDYYFDLKSLEGSNKNEKLREISQKLELEQHLMKFSEELSGGNMRKLQVAIALLSNPSLLLLDEPSSGMDPLSRQWLYQLLNKEISSDKSMVLTTHSIEEAQQIATNVGVIERGGSLKYVGSVEQLRQQSRVRVEITLIICPSVHQSDHYRIESLISEINSNLTVCKVISSEEVGERKIRVRVEGINNVREMSRLIWIVWREMEKRSEIEEIRVEEENMQQMISRL